MSIINELEIRAKAEGERLYIEKVKAFYEDMLETFQVPYTRMEIGKELRLFHKIRFGQNSIDCMKAFTEFYAKVYLDEFVAKVEASRELEGGSDD